MRISAKACFQGYYIILALFRTKRKRNYNEYILCVYYTLDTRLIIAIMWLSHFFQILHYFFTFH